MPIDASIALGVKPMQVKSQGEYLNELYNQQNAEQTNQLNAMKMGEYTRGLSEDEAVNNALSKLDKTSPTYEQDRFNAYALKGIEGVKAYAATKKDEAQAETAGIETKGKMLANASAGQTMANKSFNDIYKRPDTNNLKALYADAEDSGLYDKTTLAGMKRRMESILSIPEGEIDPTTGRPDLSARRQAIDAMQLEAKDRLSKPGQRNLNNVIEDTMTDPVTGKVTVTGTSKLGISPDTTATINATATQGTLNRQNAKDVAKLRNSGDLTPEQNEALYGVNGAVTTGKLDPYKINGRNSHILANAYLSNPNTDMNKLASDAVMMRNAPTMNRAYTTEQLPTIISNVVEAGKKVGYNDNKYFGKVQEYLNGVSNDPNFINYMTQRNDALLTITSIMRGNGATDQAHRAEIEAAPSTMSPKAFDAWAAGQMKALEPRLKQAGKFTRTQIAPAATTSTPTTGANPHANKTDAEIKAELGI